MSESPYKANHVGPHPLDDAEWVVEGPGMEGGQRMTIGGDQFTAKSAARIANVAFQQGKEEALREVDEAAALSTESAGWQPIETAPTDNTPVLVWQAPWEFPSRATFTTDDEVWCSAGGIEVNPTHWMPLPTPPSEGESNG